MYAGLDEAVDWVHAILMGLTPERIPLTRETFTPYRFHLTDYPPEDIIVHVDGLPVQWGELFARYGYKFRLLIGWDLRFGRATQVSETAGELV